MCLKAQKICQVRVRKRVYTGRFQPSVTILFQYQKHPNKILCSDFEYFLQILKLKIDFLPQIEYTERRKHLGGFAMLLQFSVTNHRSIKDTAIISMKASTDKSLSDCLISSDGKNSLCLFLPCMAQMQPERAMFSMHSCSCVRWSAAGMPSC